VFITWVGLCQCYFLFAVLMFFYVHCAKLIIIMMMMMMIIIIIIRAARHHALNDLVARSFAAAGVSVTKEPAGLLRTDGKRPAGVTLVPWEKCKSLCWDVTVTCPLAESYIDRAAHEAGAAAEMAASGKVEKYVDLGARYIFGRFNASARHLLELG